MQFFYCSTWLSFLFKLYYISCVYVLFCVSLFLIVLLRPDEKEKYICTIWKSQQINKIQLLRRHFRSVWCRVVCQKREFVDAILSILLWQQRHVHIHHPNYQLQLVDYKISWPWHWMLLWQSHSLWRNYTVNVSHNLWQVSRVTETDEILLL